MTPTQRPECELEKRIAKLGRRWHSEHYTKPQVAGFCKELYDVARSLTAELAEAKKFWVEAHDKLLWYDERVKERDAAQEQAKIAGDRYQANLHDRKRLIEERDAALAAAESFSLRYEAERRRVQDVLDAKQRWGATYFEARAEAKAQDEIHWKTRRALIKDRDAALAEMKSAASDALNTFEINEVLKKELTEARAEIEALRAALDEHHRDLHIFWKRLDGTCKMCGQPSARLAPAPAPKEASQ